MRAIPHESAETFGRMVNGRARLVGRETRATDGNTMFAASRAAGEVAEQFTTTNVGSYRGVADFQWGREG